NSVKTIARPRAASVILRVPTTLCICLYSRLDDGIGHLKPAQAPGHGTGLGRRKPIAGSAWHPAGLPARRVRSSRGSDIACVPACQGSFRHLPAPRPKTIIFHLSGG